VSARTDRRLVLVTAALFVISTMCPIVASVPQPVLAWTLPAALSLWEGAPRA
jgi:hypothetical protein